MRNDLSRVTVDGKEYPVTIDLAGGKVELDVDGHVASIAIRAADRTVAAVHTEVPAALRGKKIGDLMARALLDYLRREQKTIEPYCPFVAAYIKRHTEYADLVSPDFTG
jgi:uncharacterized protein